jgi:hypothetical protein
MVLSDLASIATAISGLAVTASLIYVGIQTKQNVRHTRALIHQGTAARTTNLLLGFMNPEAVKAWIEGNGHAHAGVDQTEAVLLSVRRCDDCDGRLFQPARGRPSKR